MPINPIDGIPDWVAEKAEKDMARVGSHVIDRAMGIVEKHTKIPYFVEDILERLAYKKIKMPKYRQAYMEYVNQLIPDEYEKATIRASERNPVNPYRLNKKQSDYLDRQVARLHRQNIAGPRPKTPEELKAEARATQRRQAAAQAEKDLETRVTQERAEARRRADEARYRRRQEELARQREAFARQETRNTAERALVEEHPDAGLRQAGTRLEEAQGRLTDARRDYAAAQQADSRGGYNLRPEYRKEQARIAGAQAEVDTLKRQFVDQARRVHPEQGAFRNYIRKVEERTLNPNILRTVGKGVMGLGLAAEALHQYVEHDKEVEQAGRDAIEAIKSPVRTAKEFGKEAADFYRIMTGGGKSDKAIQKKIKTDVKKADQKIGETLIQSMMPFTPNYFENQRKLQDIKERFKKGELTPQEMAIYDMATGA